MCELINEVHHQEMAALEALDYANMLHSEEMQAIMNDLSVDWE